MKHTYKSKYTFADKVYVKTDPDQIPRFIVSVNFSTGQVAYQVKCLDIVSFHYEFELDSDMDLEVKFNCN
jgi:hypothetical protein